MFLAFLTITLCTYVAVAAVLLLCFFVSPYMGACLAPTAVVADEASAGRLGINNRYNQQHSSGNGGGGNNSSNRINRNNFAQALGPKRMTPIVELTCDTRLDSTISVATNHSKTRLQHQQINRSTSNSSPHLNNDQPASESKSPKPTTSLHQQQNHQTLTRNRTKSTGPQMMKSVDKPDQFTPDVIAVFRNSYNAIHGEDKQNLAINVFKKVIRTMPSAATCFAAAAATASEESGKDMVDFDGDGSASLARKGLSLLADLEICLASLHDPKIFKNIIVNISGRQHSWVASRQILRVAIFALETEILATIRQLRDKMPPDCKCLCPDANAPLNDDWHECFMCDSWKKLFQYLFNTFVQKVNRKRVANQTF